ncbi:MAG TPA: hypothetical protein VFH39_01205 [Candidatus Saccharimonadales bacterium]|nr:hypothetical protein [Candidatus Saccharimonadales bacterium]
MKDIQSILDKLRDFTDNVKRYLPVLFVVLLLVIYGFLMMQITALSNPEPPSGSSTPEATAQVPRINPALVKQLQSLQDNSTNVKALFDQARQNPFQE